MLLKRTNIEEKLNRLKTKSFTEESIMNDIQQIFAEVDVADEAVKKNLTSSHQDKTFNHFNLDLLATEHIYHIDQIKQICVDYRLRFLDTKFFKGQLPYEAISKIKELEKDHQIELKGFKIIAPSKLFKLENADDPLLFAPIGNDYYYLIHKWGNDLSPFRKWLMMPFRNFENLVFTTLMVSFLVTFMVPDGLFSNGMTPTEFWMIFFFMFKSVAAIVIYYGFAAGKNFNTAIWDSKYFNA
ncbi:MAG: hypothetical protein HKN99_02560 [Winogradskyella sp.]|nr:hypothetical protein [Winogradskyella sp.]NNC44742.1 hypothetical protein [Winogradskyella sp.]NNF86453.1 hypothetical protein [Winogradskyella sp.]NNK39931.1 hypothetical protein [Winogradskyella sp.]NNL81882.1 hypothetical protein [Winogradskyella sp.]